MSPTPKATDLTGAMHGARVRISISGWRHAGWRGRFYPASPPTQR